MAGVVPAVGCDQPELDEDAMDIAEEDFGSESGDFEEEEEKDVDADPLEHAPAQLLAGPDDPSGNTVNVFSRRSVLQTSTLVDGEVVMLHHHSEGYLGCDENGATRTDQIAYNTNTRAWRVHLVDLDDDGRDEMQFELVDNTGFTGKYLKMNKWGFLQCSPITGIGDAAAWSWGSWYGHSGAPYQKISRDLVNYKQRKCIHATDVGEIGTHCSNSWAVYFNMEILDDVLM